MAHLRGVWAIATGMTLPVLRTGSRPAASPLVQGRPRQWGSQAKDGRPPEANDEFPSEFAPATPGVSLYISQDKGGGWQKRARASRIEPPRQYSPCFLKLFSRRQGWPDR